MNEMTSAISSAQVLEIDWKDDPLSGGYVDLIPAEWLSSRQTMRSLQHYIRGPRGGLSEARCDLHVRPGAIELDYKPYATFNTARDMFLGDMRLVLGKGNEVVAVYWKDAQHGSFRKVDVSFTLIDALPPIRWLWFESTGRDDVGSDLRAPLQDDGEQDNWRYTLFKHARPGDPVLHYHKGAQAIVGCSTVAASWRRETVVWGARGSYARQRNETPYKRDGYVVELYGFKQLSSPVALAEIRGKVDQVRAVRDEAARRENGALYFPFELGFKRAARPLQGYAFRVPAGFLDLFPALEAAGGTASARGAWERAKSRIIQTTLGTVSQSGKEATRRLKNKELRCVDLGATLDALANKQAYRCAQTNVPFNEDDDDLRASLDRIDSDGHYADGSIDGVANLQLVTHWYNIAKGTRSDREMIDLLLLHASSAAKGES